jgi:DNA-binding NarL/FixJ family response regulator
MAEHSETLARAREAYANHDWPAAAAGYDSLSAANLSADDLAAFADAMWWLGNTEDRLRLGAASYDAFLAESRPANAAMAAVLLGILHIARGDQPQGIGWIGRAGRLAEGLPECVVHGFMLFLTAVEGNLQAGKPTEAVVAARQLQELGRRLDEPDLVAMGIQAEGRALIKAGNTADGLALVDEAMVAVLEGRLTPFTLGTLYCHTIAACHEVAELQRMVRWTDLTEKWLGTLPVALPFGGPFGGLCAVHRAQLHLLRGAWDESERSALQIVHLLDTSRLDYAAEAWYIVAESRRLRGDPAASEAYDEAHARGRNPQPGRALLRLAHGDAEGAARSMRSALVAAGADPLRRAPLCAAAVEIALAAGRPQESDVAAAELHETASTYATSGLKAMAASARGAALLANGRPEEALPVLREAFRDWQELGAVYEAARACVLLAQAYRNVGDEESAASEEALANATFERLGARRAAREAPDGLTTRECEVLALVAEGRSNRQIGEALFISDRTVARHLTNIFHKIDVESRTQAARYAIEHGLTRVR